MRKSSRFGPQPQTVSDWQKREILDADSSSLLQRMRAANNTGDIRYFQQGNKLLLVSDSDDAQLHSEPVVHILDRELLSQEIRCLHPYSNSAVNPKSVQEFLKLGHYPGLPYLSSVRQAPFFTAQGQLVTWDGYNQETGAYVRLNKGLLVPPICSNPSPESVTEAKHVITEELLGDLPFSSGTDLASAVACLLYPSAADLIDASAPILITEGNAAVVVSLIALVHAGREPDTVITDLGRVEVKKDLLPILIARAPCARLDLRVPRFLLRTRSE